MENERAVLLVSFGTSYREAREKTLEPIETQVREACPQWAVYHAWTSPTIRKKLKERDGEEIPDVTQSLEQMRRDGIREAVVQPTFLLKAIEYEGMLADLEEGRDFLETIRVGEPILADPEEGERIVRTLAGELPVGERDALVLAGHGTAHPANAIYGLLQQRLREDGIPNLYIGTIEAEPSLGDVLEEVRQAGPRRVVLAPLLLVAGDHAQTDLGGPDPDSWRNRFRAEGFEVDCVLKGLGEYPAIRRIIPEHLKRAADGLQDRGKSEIWA